MSELSSKVKAPCTTNEETTDFEIENEAASASLEHTTAPTTTALLPSDFSPPEKGGRGEKADRDNDNILFSTSTPAFSYLPDYHSHSTKPMTSNYNSANNNPESSPSLSQYCPHIPQTQLEQNNSLDYNLCMLNSLVKTIDPLADFHNLLKIGEGFISSPCSFHI